MATDPLTRISTRNTPQSQPIPGTVPNSGGGYSFPVDDWTRLNRFLILGTEGGSYYSSEAKLTKENAQALFRCIKEDGPRVVSTIVDISVAGRNPKQGPIMFALAACAGADDQATRDMALRALPKVARTGTHLFLFAKYVEQFRGWGRGLRTAIGNWYTDREVSDLVLQLAKYQSREGWSHRDLLRLAKPRPERGSETDLALGWAVGKLEASGAFLTAVEDIKTAPKAHAVALIREHRLPWEVVPDALMNEPEILEALLPSMGCGALVRQLGRFSYSGTTKAMGSAVTNKAIIAKLTDAEYVRRSRIHPLNVLTAALTYGQGKGVKGSKMWTPVHGIVDALDETFKLAFANVVPANVPTLLALDVSSSMTWGNIAGTYLTPNVAAAAMALVTAATEPEYHILGFADDLRPLNITAKSSLTQAVAVTRGMSFGSTDCALPMTWAKANKVPVGNFVVYTDSETNTGRAHPVQALRMYRQAMGVQARSVVVGMVSNGFSIADPSDAGMLDVVGFDSAAPALIADFGGGRV